jgi:ParB family chromosome partitioning protein
MAKNALALKEAVKGRSGNIQQDNSGAIDSSYQYLFGVPENEQVIRHIPIEKLVDFFTAKLHFRDLTDDELLALAESIENIGMQDEPIVRPIPETDKFEIIAGMHRRKAHQLKGWKTVRVKIIETTDAQAVLIATDTNLKRRQNLLPSEKAYAYRLQIEAMRHQGVQIYPPETLEHPESDTSVQIEQKSNMTTREKVAQIYNVKPSEVQRHIRLTHLIPTLLEAVDSGLVPMSVGYDISYYDEDTQELICNFCLFEKVRSLNIKTAEILKEKYAHRHQ